MSEDKRKEIFRKNLLRYIGNKSQSEIAKAIGVSPQTFNTWCQGIAMPRMNKIQLLADYFKISISDLIEEKRANEFVQSIRIPVLGRVAAGIPLDAIQEIIDYEEVDDKTASLGDLFALKIKGDSMTPRICDGDVVIVQKQPSADSGDIVIATINGDDAVCKKLLIYGNTILLRSNNPAYEDIDVTGRTDFQIWGKVIELRGKL